MPKKRGKGQRAKGKDEQPVVKNRKIAQPTYKSFQLSKKIKHSKAPIQGSFRLFAVSLKFLLKRKRLFGGIVLIYLLLTVVLVKGFGVGGDIAELKSNILELFNGSGSQFLTSLTLFGVLLSNINSASSEVAGAYQSLLLIVISLVFIWALRQTSADKDKTKPGAVSIRDAFYKGPYPLVPFVLVLLVIGLQLLPIGIASSLYQIVFGNALAVTAVEQLLWWLLIGLLVLLSLYMITSSIFALYIVTLPNIRPVEALRSARELVRYRRWVVMRKFLFLPVALLVLAGSLVIPVIIISPAVAEWLFFILSMLALAIVHSYLYHLYRELL